MRGKPVSSRRERCPQPTCEGKRSKSLKITAMDNGAEVFFCHRCGWTGHSGPGGTSGRSSRPRIATLHPSGLAPWAQQLWDACEPVRGSAAEAYLEARGCRLPDADDVLRCHPRLKHQPTGALAPCMVALVTDIGTGEPISLHRTWIRADGTKPPGVEPAKMLLSGHRVKGGVIRLSRDEHVETKLGIAEGIETALAAAHVFEPVWSCMDAGHISMFPVLPGIETLCVFADNDIAGIKAACEVTARWASAERDARYVIPSQPGWDWLDEVAA